MSFDLARMKERFLLKGSPALDPSECYFCAADSNPSVPFVFVDAAGKVVGGFCALCWEGVLAQDETDKIRESDATIRQILALRDEP